MLTYTLPKDSNIRDMAGNGLQISDMGVVFVTN